MLAASVISTINVDLPCAKSSLAPIREQIRLIDPIVAEYAGTKLPIVPEMIMAFDAYM
jgi:hypothetical protein